MSQAPEPSMPEQYATPHKFKDLAQKSILILLLCVLVASFFFLAREIYKRQTLSYQVQKSIVAHNQARKAFFSPDDNITDKLLGLIEQEKESIALAIFSFTNRNVAQALIDATKRGVKVEIVADGDNSTTQYSKIPFLRRHDIPIWRYPPQSGALPSRQGIMHNKFIIFGKSLQDKPLLWTGSFNITKSANDRNQENVIIFDDPDLLEDYRGQFEILKRRSVPW